MNTERSQAISARRAKCGCVTHARLRALSGCCRGCDTKWGHGEGQCRTCGLCYGFKCCGNEGLPGSCAHERRHHTSVAKQARRNRGYESYWKSVDTGKVGR